MKRYRFLFLLLAALSMTSCLDEHPKDQLDEDAIYGSASDIYINAVVTQVFAMFGQLFHIAWFPAPNLCHDWLLIIGFYQPAANRFFSSMHPARGVGKLTKKDIWCTCLLDDMAKYDIRDSLHRSENKKRFRKFLPEVSH